jgi:pyrimidine operon attenuation protein/uracil phosphoribosyltransferase
LSLQVATNGFIFAKNSCEFRVISSSFALRVQINKQHPELPIHLFIKDEYANKGLVLVDDVLNSGTTLIYAVGIL